MSNDAVGDRISELADSADPDSDLNDHCDQISAYLRDIEVVTSDNGDLQPKIQELEEELTEAKASVKASKSDEDSGSFWDRVVPGKVGDSTTGRSIFSDVDD